LKIPIENLYFLLLYAWDHLEEGDTVSISALRSEQPLDLLAHVLAKGTEHVLKRGLDRGYVLQSEPLSRLRGRIDFAASVHGGTLARRRLWCQHDDLSHDVLHNQIVKATLRALAEVAGLDRELRGELLRLHDRMGAVTEIRISSGHFGRVRLHRNNRFYRLLLSVCHAVHDGVVLDEAAGTLRFREFLRDEVRMRLLFQNFVKNLLKRRLGRDYKVASRQLEWQNVAGPPDQLRLIPTLNMDVVVEKGSRVLVIETKYTPEVTTVRFNVERARTDHLYQLFAYVQNYAAAAAGRDIKGLLLYPQSARSLDASFSIHGHVYRIATLNLAQSWSGVEADLLELAKL
jgi:5-methylcytosine-specific restriction enzyme subunit McrC